MIISHEWFVYLVPLSSNDNCSLNGACLQHFASGSIKLYGAHWMGNQQNDNTIVLGRSQIMASLTDACTNGSCQTTSHSSSSMKGLECSCKKWVRYGARFLNKNMLQFSLVAAPTGIATGHQWRCLVRSCGKHVLPTIFINNVVLSSIEGNHNGDIALCNHDQLSFVVPYRDETLELSYRVLIHLNHSPISYTMEDDDSSSTLSLYHFSHSMESLQSLSERLGRHDSISSSLRSSRTVDLNTHQKQDRVLLSTLPHYQLKALLANNQLTISNEMLIATAAVETQTVSGKNEFICALMTLAIRSTRNNQHGYDSPSFNFPELLERITISDHLKK